MRRTRDGPLTAIVKSGGAAALLFGFTTFLCFVLFLGFLLSSVRIFIFRPLTYLGALGALIALRYKV